MRDYLNEPGDGHKPVKRLNVYGGEEAHSCIEDCEAIIYVCDLCGGDFHEKKEETAKCPLKK